MWANPVIPVKLVNAVNVVTPELLVNQVNPVPMENQVLKVLKVLPVPMVFQAELLLAHEALPVNPVSMVMTVLQVLLDVLANLADPVKLVAPALTVPPVDLVFQVLTVFLALEVMTEMMLPVNQVLLVILVLQEKLVKKGEPVSPALQV